MGCSRMSFIKLSVNVTNACELVFGLQIDFDTHTHIHLTAIFSGLPG